MASSYTDRLTQLGLSSTVTTLPDDQAVWSDPAGGAEWTDPLPDTRVSAGSTVDVTANPDPMPDPTENGDRDYPDCDLSESNYAQQDDQNPDGLTQVTDPDIVESPTFDTTKGTTVLNYGWASLLGTDPLDFDGYGYWHILAGHGWSLADDEATRTALEDPDPLPGTNADALEAWEFYGPEYSGTGVTCRREVLVEFDTAPGDSGPKGIITSYGVPLADIPISKR
jgi:hypothetical protein